MKQNREGDLVELEARLKAALDEARRDASEFLATDPSYEAIMRRFSKIYLEASEMQTVERDKRGM